MGPKQSSQGQREREREPATFSGRGRKSRRWRWSRGTPAGSWSPAGLENETEKEIENRGGRKNRGFHGFVGKGKMSRKYREGGLYNQIGFTRFIHLICSRIIPHFVSSHLFQFCWLIKLVVKLALANLLEVYSFHWL